MSWHEERERLMRSRISDLDLHVESSEIEHAAGLVEEQFANRLSDDGPPNK